MTEEQKEIMEGLLAELRGGGLTESRLRGGISELVEANGKRGQDLLYLQARTTSPVSQVAGMMLIEGGERREVHPDPEDWPYQTVLDAVKDGWRIISFPNMALLAVNEKEFHGLGFEFILERWR